MATTSRTSPPGMGCGGRSPPVTTVGYGDVSPQTNAGRAIAIVVMLVGIGFVAILTAAAADRFMASRREASEERHEVMAWRVRVRLAWIAEAWLPPSNCRLSPLGGD